MSAGWDAPDISIRTRQRLLHAVIVEIVADVDEAAREVVLPSQCLDRVVARRYRQLINQRTLTMTRFHWWPTQTPRN